MGSSKVKLISLFLALLGVFMVQAQTTTSKWISLEIGSAYGNRFLVNTNPSASYGFTEQELNDSFKKSDSYTDLYHAGIGVYFQSKARVKYYAGFSISEWGFERLKNGNMFGYQPHPELSTYAALTQGGTQQLVFQYKQRYMQFTSRYLRQLNGQRLQLGTEFDLWFVGEGNIGWIVGDEMIISTRGFSLVEGNRIVKYDYTEQLNNDGTVSFERVYNPKVNASIGFGLRGEYHLDAKWSVDGKAIIKSMLSPNHTGIITAVGYQAGIQLGIQYRIP